MCRASAARPGLGLLKVLSALLSPITACAFGGLRVFVWRDAGRLCTPPVHFVELAIVFFSWGCCGCGIFCSSCSTLAFGFVLALLVFPAWLALDVLPALAFSGLSLSADSVSLSGVVLAASALPKSTSSSWPSSSSAWVGMAAASLAVGCGVFLASSVLPPLCCLALAFGFVFAFRVFPAWPVFPSLLSSFAGCGGPL